MSTTGDRLREYARATVKPVTAPNGETLDYRDTIMWLAADELDRCASELESLRARIPAGWRVVPKALKRAGATIALINQGRQEFAEILAEIDAALVASGGG